MATLSWNEIQNRAVDFAAKYKNDTYEKGESQSFWTDFLNVFGIDRKRAHVAFEHPIKKLDGNYGFIDMFWPGKLIAEQKSGGKSLEGANQQARGYLNTIPQEQLPKAIVVSDFENIHIDFIDMAENKHVEFKLKDFPKKVKLFAFLIDREALISEDEDPVNRKAAELMARLHNQLRENNYTGSDLEILLVRLVFVLFADDSGIWEHDLFENYVKNRTSEDGTDLGPKLLKVFQLLNKPEKQRQTELDDDLRSFPYIDGGLFEKTIEIPDFNSALRTELLNAMKMDWSEVSPAIFGSMFQGVMDKQTRRNLGAHYTSEKNILKLIKPLFLDDLYAEFEEVKDNKKKLVVFHDKLANLKFLDPACGCGNFLVITYRELRRLEHKVLEGIHGRQSLLTNVTESIKLDVDQFYGIEIKEFPALIAETALWLTDHQMNMEATEQFGHHFARLPLKKSGKVVKGNALTLDWSEIVRPADLNYILGNPPFIGSKLMSAENRQELLNLFPKLKGGGNLDYVSAWYSKAISYIKLNKDIQAAFVSTNSITQGEQVGILWKELSTRGISINFAHQTFKWTNDAKGNAGVYCVIIGFGLRDKPEKALYEYENIKAEPKKMIAKNISPYLVDAPNIFLENRSKAICDVPKINYGSFALDDGNYTLSEKEKEQLIRSNPLALKYIRPFIGGQELIHNEKRYCLWLKDAQPEEINRLPLVLERIEKVRKWRLSSNRENTKKLGDTPTIFAEIRQPKTKYIALPTVSSENRRYIPIAYLEPDIIASNQVYVIAGASLYHFGILNSIMHMSWVKFTCGRLESRYRYSSTLVYNNFPWPENITSEQIDRVALLAQAILDARNEFPKSSLANLYDPRTMPPSLTKAHQALDKYVDGLYQRGVIVDDSERVALLFERYKELTSK